MIGAECSLHTWERQPGIWFADPGEIEAHYGRRLLLAPGRRHELRDLLPVREVDGRYLVGDEARTVVTVVFEVPDPAAARGAGHG